MRRALLIVFALVCVFAFAGTAEAGPLCRISGAVKAVAGRTAGRVAARRSARRAGSATGILGRTRFFDGDGRRFTNRISRLTAFLFGARRGEPAKASLDCGGRFRRGRE
jgi:hypothetical protein